MTRIPTYRARFFKAGICALGALIFFSAIIAVANRPAKAPKPEEMAGVWIGFDSDGLEFTRLDLRADFTGYCARVSPADTVLHEHGVQGYRVTKWTVDGWKVVISLTPVDTKAEAVYLRGRFSGFSLRLEVGGADGKWKRDLVLYRESRTDAANQETRGKIKLLDKR